MLSLDILEHLDMLGIIAVGKILALRNLRCSSISSWGFSHLQTSHDIIACNDVIAEESDGRQVV